MTETQKHQSTPENEDTSTENIGEFSFHLQTRFHVPRPTQKPPKTLRIRGYHPLSLAFPNHSASSLKVIGLFRFRSPLLTESLLISFPLVTKMFQFSRFASSPYRFR